MKFVMRPKECSPIYLNMLRSAKTDEDFARAAAYGEKVDEFNRTGVLLETTLPYEGPDLSAGAERLNCMRGGGYGMKRPAISLGEGGRRLVPLIHGDDLAHG